MEAIIEASIMLLRAYLTPLTRVPKPSSLAPPTQAPKKREIIPNKDHIASLAPDTLIQICAMLDAYSIVRRIVSKYRVQNISRGIDTHPHN